MAKKSAPRRVEPENESQELPDEESVVTPEPTISKADAIRKPLADGITKARDGVDHIFKTYGLHVTIGHFSSSKSREKEPSPAEATKKRRRPPGSSNAPKPVAKQSAKAVEGYFAPPAKPLTEGGESELLAALEAMKPLVASLGADKIHRLVDLLG